MADDIRDAIRWQPLHTWPVSERPVRLWTLLACETSLTERLRALVGSEFRVTVLAEHETELTSDEAALIGASSGHGAWVREVYLGGKEPWVYARTAANAGESGARLLKALGTTPLGDRVFDHAQVRRGPIEAAPLDDRAAVYRAAVAGLTAPPAILWARRSVLTADEARFLICECFLREP